MKTLVTTFTLALCAPAVAQTNSLDFSAHVQRCAQLDDGGIFDVVSGTWTPPVPGGAQLATPGVVYNNTCIPAAYIDWFSAFNNEVWLDWARMPSASSPAPATGTLNRNHIGSIVVGYCTTDTDTSLGGTGTSMRIYLYEDYDACTGFAAAGAPTAVYTLTGMPGTLTPGSVRCLALTISLAGIEADLLADADGAYQGGSPNNDTFGIGLELFNQAATTLATVGGFVLAGDITAPGNCGAGDGTYYLNPGTLAGSGLDNTDAIYLDDPVTPANSGCGNFGGPPNNPHAGFYIRMTGDLDDCNANQQPDAFDLSSGASFDLNLNGIPDECEPPVVVAYCTSSTTSHGCIPSISGTGTPSASAVNGFTISIASVEGLQSGLIFYGIDNTGFTPLPWSAVSTSFMCVKSPFERTPVQNAGGTLLQCDGALSIDWNAFRATHPAALGNPFSAGAQCFAQGWFRDPPASKTTNLSNALQFGLAP